MDPFDANQHPVSVAHDTVLNNYAHITAMTILYFDHLITLPQEVACIWSRPRSRSSIWFFLNRYISFFGNIAVTAANYSLTTTKGCDMFGLFHQVLLLVVQTLVCVLLCLRTFALYNSNRWMLAFLLAVGIPLAGYAAFSIVGQTSVTIVTDHQGCQLALSDKTGRSLAVPWESQVAWDTVIFVLTLFKTYNRRSNRPGRFNLPYLILRDGAMYFLVMLLANTANSITFYLGGPVFKGGLSTLASSVSVTMLSRLMLNLHDTAAATTFSSGALPSSASTSLMTTRIQPPERSDFGTLSQWTAPAPRADVEMRAFGESDLDLGKAEGQGGQIKRVPGEW